MAHPPPLVVALSGGIDSAVAALLLQRQGGRRLSAIFMHNWDGRIEDGDAGHRPACQSEGDYASARRVAAALAIPLRRVDLTRQYWQHVFEPLLRGYQAGATPNPDILCNRAIKFGALLHQCLGEQATLPSDGPVRLATGHYAQIDQYPEALRPEGRRGSSLCIAQAVDRQKDQSYFLAGIRRDVLARIVFPLGGLTKDHVRRLAGQTEGLAFLLDRPESMGVCFIGKRSGASAPFSAFLSQFIGAQSAGDIIQCDGPPHRPVGGVVGRHQGLASYTIGQRVPISGAKGRLYVVAKDGPSNAIFVSSHRLHPLLAPRAITVTFADEEDYDAVASAPPPGCAMFCSIRSADKIGQRVVAAARLAGAKGPPRTLSVTSDEPFAAPAPGQAAVFYFRTGDAATGRSLVVACGTIAPSHCDAPSAAPPSH